MKVNMRNWQPAASSRQSQHLPLPAEDINNKKDTGIPADETEKSPLLTAETNSQINAFQPAPDQFQEQESLLSSLLEQAKESSNFKVSVSTPDDSTGQLASELASAETKMNVLQVSSKAMRALATLKMSYALSEGKDKEKIAQMIRRMQKLTKQIQKKIKNLAKEEQLELRRKHAEEKQEMEKELELRREISRKKKKRHREEHNYAANEMNEDRKEAMQETIDAMAASIGSSSTGLSALAGISGTAASAAAIAVGTEAYVASSGFPAAESLSVDIIT